MAADSDTTIQFDYPPLDSWRYLKNGTFQYNTSGFIGPKLPQRAKISKICGPETNEDNKKSHSGSQSRPSKETRDFQDGQDEAGASGAPTSYRQDETGQTSAWQVRYAGAGPSGTQVSFRQQGDAEALGVAI